MESVKRMPIVQQVVDKLKEYRLDVPQVTVLSDLLRKKGLEIPAGILKKEELVDAICRLN